MSTMTFRARDNATALELVERRFGGDALILFPVSTADTDTADTFVFEENRKTAFHRSPAFRPGGQRETDRVERIEMLPLGTARRCRPAIGRRGFSFGER